MKRVSVIIPSYNRASLVLETIRNLQAQTLLPFEIIIVDDGSTDGSREILRSITTGIIVIEQPNAGPGAARNAGLAVASGEFVQFMDSDDLASLNKLEAQVVALEEKQADMAFSPWLHIEWGAGLKTTPRDVLQTRHPGYQRSLLHWHLMGWCLVLQNCLFRRSFLERVGNLKTDLLGTEDWEYFNRIFLANPSTVFTPNCFLFYRLHNGDKLSDSGTTSQKKSEELAKAARYIESNMADRSITISWFSRLFLRFKFYEIEQSSATIILTLRPKAMEKLLFCLFSFRNWLSAGVRRRFLGHSWQSFYHRQVPSSVHFKLMNEAGILYSDPS